MWTSKRNQKLPPVTRTSLGKNTIAVQQRFEIVFICASILGIHIFRKDNDGFQVLSARKAIARAFCFMTNIVVVLEAGLSYYTQKWPVWFLVMTLPFWYVCLFNIFAYYSLSKRYALCKLLYNKMELLKTFDNFGVKVRLAWILGFTAVFIGGTLIVMPDDWYFLSIPIGISTIVPAVVDTYAGIHVHVFTTSFKNLACRVQKTKKPKVRDIEEFSLEWLYLRDTLNVYNEVKSFSVLHLFPPGSFNNPANCYSNLSNRQFLQ